jgi:hypothetical protein
MSLKVKKSGTFQAVGTSSGTPDTFGWVRPSDWLPMPTVLDTETKFVGLLAVYDVKGPQVALSATVTGGYTVDWGDGNVENFASAAVATHAYNYQALPSSSLSSRGYKQVLVTVTRQNTANNLTNVFRLNHQPTTTHQQIQWLDIAMSFPNLATELLIAANGHAQTSITGTWELLERVRIVNCRLNSTGSLFLGLLNLQSYEINNNNPTPTTSIGRMFESCKNLTKVTSLGNASATATVHSAFSGCTNLIEVPVFTISSAATSISSMFATCTRLKTIPAIDLSVLTSPTTNTSIFNGGNIEQFLAIGPRINFTVANNQMGREALVTLLTNLPDQTSLTGYTVTVTGNPGAASLTADDIAIATAKNWNVTT